MQRNMYTYGIGVWLYMCTASLAYAATPVVTFVGCDAVLGAGTPGTLTIRKTPTQHVVTCSPAAKPGITYCIQFTKNAVPTCSGLAKKDPAYGIALTLYTKAWRDAHKSTTAKAAATQPAQTTRTATTHVYTVTPPARTTAPTLYYTIPTYDTRVYTQDAPYPRQQQTSPTTSEPTHVPVYTSPNDPELQKEFSSISDMLPHMDTTDVAKNATVDPTQVGPGWRNDALRESDNIEDQRPPVPEYYLPEATLRVRYGTTMVDMLQRTCEETKYASTQCKCVFGKVSQESCRMPK